MLMKRREIRANYDATSIVVYQAYREQIARPALANAVLTSPERSVYPDAEEWRRQFEQASVIVQWDPEPSLRGATLQVDSIQVGLSRRVIER
jgi:hypothetical protein